MSLADIFVNNNINNINNITRIVRVRITRTIRTKNQNGKKIEKYKEDKNQINSHNKETVLIPEMIGMKKRRKDDQILKKTFDQLRNLDQE